MAKYTENSADSSYSQLGEGSRLLLIWLVKEGKQ